MNVFRLIFSILCILSVCACKDQQWLALIKGLSLNAMDPLLPMLTDSSKLTVPKNGPSKVRGVFVGPTSIDEYFESWFKLFHVLGVKDTFLMNEDLDEKESSVVYGVIQLSMLHKQQSMDLFWVVEIETMSNKIQRIQITYDSIAIERMLEGKIPPNMITVLDGRNVGVASQETKSLMNAWKEGIHNGELASTLVNRFADDGFIQHVGLHGSIDVAGVYPKSSLLKYLEKYSQSLKGLKGSIVFQGADQDVGLLIYERDGNTPTNRNLRKERMAYLIKTRDGEKTVISSVSCILDSGAFTPQSKFSKWLKILLGVSVFIIVLVIIGLVSLYALMNHQKEKKGRRSQYTASPDYMLVPED